jgi:serine/threonine protein kinase
VKACTVYQPGQTIAGRYAVERVFEGGMGTVYIAYDKTRNLRFAIKQPRAWLLAVPDYFARVVREADAWTGLGMHPHVAYCYFVRSIEEVPHIFVEYVDGDTLEDWIADGKAWTTGWGWTWPSSAVTGWSGRTAGGCSWT